MCDPGRKSKHLAFRNRRLPYNYMFSVHDESRWILPGLKRSNEYHCPTHVIQTQRLILHVSLPTNKYQHCHGKASDEADNWGTTPGVPLGDVLDRDEQRDRGGDKKHDSNDVEIEKLLAK